VVGFRWKAIIESSIYERYFVSLWLENHTLFIHLHEIYCIFAVGKSSFKSWDPSTDFHEHLVRFHTPQFISLGWISSCNRMIIISFGNIYIYHIVWIHTPTVGKSYNISYPCGWKIIS
jgi:hypothetical protein